MIKKQLLILLILLSSLAGYSQTITPQFRAVTGGLLSYFYSGKSPAGYDTIWNAQTIRFRTLQRVDTGTFVATRYWTEHQPHIWYGNQTVNGNIIISGTGNQLIMDNGSLLNGSDGFVISTSQRNGFQVFYYGTNIFSVAGTGHAADMPFLNTNVPVRINAVQGGLDYGSSGYNVLVKDNGTLGGGSSFGYVKEVPLSSFGTTGTGGTTYTKTQTDSVSNLRVPYSGATGHVNLNAKNLGNVHSMSGDTLIVNGVNGTTGVNQTGKIYEVNGGGTGSTFNNFTMSTDSSNIRFIVKSGRHFGFNIGNVTNSQVVVMHDTTTSGSISLRGANYAAGTDFSQYQLIRGGNDLYLRNFFSGGKWVMANINGVNPFVFDQTGKLIIKAASTGTVNAYVSLTNSADAERGYFKFDGVNDYIGSAGSFPLLIQSNSTTRMTVNATGLVQFSQAPALAGTGFVFGNGSSAATFVSGTGTGSVVQATSPTLVSSMNITGSAGSTRDIIGQTSAVNRWVLRLGNATAEGGSNAGSDLDIIGRADDGSSLGSWLSIKRSNGQITIPNLTASLPVFTDASKNLTNSGTMPVANGGTGQTTYTNGQLLIGNTTGNTLAKATLTGSASTGQVVTNGAGTITLSNDTTVLATRAYAIQSGRHPYILSGSITVALNADYLSTSSIQYTLTVPTTTGFATQGSQLITALATGTGGLKIVCPSGYTIQTPSGNVTPVTGSATLSQNQKVQLIPIGSNSYYLQPLNGTITVL